MTDLNPVVVLKTPQVAVEGLVRRSPQTLDRSGMRPDDVRHVAECEPHLRRHVAGRRATEAREFRRVAEPPLREASDETEGNHPGEDVLEDLPADQVRKKRPERHRIRRILSAPRASSTLLRLSVISSSMA